MGTIGSPETSVLNQLSRVITQNTEELAVSQSSIKRGAMMMWRGVEVLVVHDVVSFGFQPLYPTPLQEVPSLSVWTFREPQSRAVCVCLLCGEERIVRDRRLPLRLN
jgi:hypothetical protein